jgi:DNA repair protein RecO (recombination protein O)
VNDILMIRNEKISGLVLSRRNIGESDRLITLFSKEYGVLKIVAKGVRKIPSRRGGHIEPLTSILAVVSGSRESRFLMATETIDYYSSLRTNEEALERANVIAWVVKALLCDGQAGQQIFNVVCWAYRTMPRLSTVRQSLVEGCVLLMIIKRAGLMPQLSKCQRCNEKNPNEAVILQKDGGGWECLSCCVRLPNKGMSLSPNGLELLRLMIINPKKALRAKVEDREVFELQKLIRKLVAIYAGEYSEHPIALCIGAR